MIGIIISSLLIIVTVVGNIIFYLNRKSVKKANKYIVKGIFIDTISSENLRIRKGYLLIENGLVQRF